MRRSRCQPLLLPRGFPKGPQQADIHLFLAEFYKDAGDFEKAEEQAELAKLRARQKIDVETGDYITKPEDTKWKHKPCSAKTVSFLSSLE